MEQRTISSKKSDAGSSQDLLRIVLKRHQRYRKPNLLWSVCMCVCVCVWMCPHMVVVQKASKKVWERVQLGTTQSGMRITGQKKTQCIKLAGLCLVPAGQDSWESSIRPQPHNPSLLWKWAKTIPLSSAEKWQESAFCLWVWIGEKKASVQTLRP